MNRKTNVLFLLVVLGMTWSSCPSTAWSQDIKTRVWTSHDGGESIRASFESFDRDSKFVTLKDEQGEVVEVMISLLSRVDRSYVARAVKQKKALQKKSSVFKKTDRYSAAEKNDEKGRSKKAKVVKGYGINWTKGIEGALASASKQQRPVMLFRVLGDLDGYM